MTCAAALAGALALVGCGGGGGDDDVAQNPDARSPGVDAAAEVDAAAPADVDAAPGPAAVLRRPSKSSTIAIGDDDRLVVLVNPQGDSISIFDASAGLARTAIVPTGREPSSVVLAPDGVTAYVANRADATVVKVSGLTSEDAAVSGTPVPVGAEPTGVALSPTGATLYVAEYAEGSIAVIDTASMTVSSVIEGSLAHPRAITVTNDGDTDDRDELIVVTEFFGEFLADGSAGDADRLDVARRGRIRIYDAATLSPQTSIVLGALDSGFASPREENQTSPNQLSSVTIRRDADAPGDSSRGRLYLTSVSASPEPPVRFDSNVYPVLYVADLQDRAEVTEGAGTKNLARLLADAAPAGTAGKLFLSEIVDMAFVTVPTDDGGLVEGSVAYVVARGADTVQRVVYDDAGGSVTLGVPDSVLQIDVAGPPTEVRNGCKGPSGIVLDSTASVAYVNCWLSHRLGVVELGGNQRLASTTESYPSGDETLGTDRGRRFFFTGRGRWSGDATGDTPATEPANNNQAWSSCGSCHPDGLSDNVTWIFAAGPRQSTGLDGSFSHGPGTTPENQEQRVFNWTGIFDEVHDFERNTRGTSGGMGAVTVSPVGACGTLAQEDRKALGGGLGDPVRGVQNDAATPACQKDWDDIEAFMRTIRPPQALRRLDADEVARGRAIFEDGTGTDKAACARCHGGAGWTASRVFFTPAAGAAGANALLLQAAFTRPPAWPTTWNNHTTQIQVEQDGSPAGQAPAQIACVLRNIGTFGGAALEQRPTLAAVSQGQFGYNVPSLYGMSLGAPYLHSGEASTLDELLDPDGPWAAHLKAGNPNFAATSGQIDALVAFLLSIDAGTTEIPIPVEFEGCPASF